MSLGILQVASRDRAGFHSSGRGSDLACLAFSRAHTQRMSPEVSTPAEADILSASQCGKTRLQFINVIIVVSVNDFHKYHASSNDYTSYPAKVC